MADVSVVIKWNGKEFNIETLSDTDTVADLKYAIQCATGVLPERQKLLGLKVKGKPATDDVQLSFLNLKPRTKIMMMGSLEETIATAAAPPEELPDVVNDFDIEEEDVAVENKDIFLAKIEKRVKEYEVKMFNQPREGKKLLVLDIDYTLFDHRSTAQTAAELMRPFLHEFLTSAYEDYDIVIWSASSMKWIEVKLKELGVADHSAYKILFYLDSGAMISVHTPKYGLVDALAFKRLGTSEVKDLYPEEVKPLGVIWGKFKQYNEKNTIMFDDLGRNFLMNPQNGLKIRPFRDAHANREKDRELLKLSKYLKDISTLPDLSHLRHKKWEKYNPHKSSSRSSKHDS